MKPTILFASTYRWFSTVRLAAAFEAAGCEVDAACPLGHPLWKSGALRRAYRLRGLTPVISLANAITAANPDLVIPTDDPAVHQLHRLHCREQWRGTKGAMISAVIERSLGPCENFPIVAARTPLMKLAEAEGVRVPKTSVIESIDELDEWIRQVGFPIVLKANHSSGSTGVRTVRSLAEARGAFLALEAPPYLRRTLAETLAHRDGPSVLKSLLRRRSVVNAQAFIAGRDAISEVACWRGQVLASLQFEVLNKQYASGPASVVRVIENEAMSSAVEKLACRLNLSGLHGFDFILEATTGNPYLLEMNPRATQVGHLTLGPARDLPAALSAALSGKPIQHAPKVTESDTIALFPQEWRRDPTSVFLQSGYHDVPWENPELVRACVGEPRNPDVGRSEQQVWVHDLPGITGSRLSALRRSKLPEAD